MHQIEIDFEVFKALTSRRASEETTYNEVIRGLLNLPNAPKSTVQSAANGRAWVVSNTSFPAGSQFMADYKGNTRSGVVKDGKLELDDGSKFTTPSAAAVHIAGHNMNGWRFWKCKLPGASQFVLIERLRGKVHTA
jgi:Restriction Enzyme Adenine Methylase Associated